MAHNAIVFNTQTCLVLIFKIEVNVDVFAIIVTCLNYLR